MRRGAAENAPLRRSDSTRSRRSRAARWSSPVSSCRHGRRRCRHPSFRQPHGTGSVRIGLFRRRDDLGGERRQEFRRPHGSGDARTTLARQWHDSRRDLDTSSSCRHGPDRSQHPRSPFGALGRVRTHRRSSHLVAEAGGGRWRARLARLSNRCRPSQFLSRWLLAWRRTPNGASPTRTSSLPERCAIGRKKLCPIPT